MKPVIHLSDRWNWMGAHSGYDLFLRHLQEADPAVVRVAPRPFAWLRGNLSARLRGGAWCCSPRTRLEEEALAQELRARPDAVAHLHYFERHHPFVREQEIDPARVVATVHHPLSQSLGWHAELTADLRRLNTAVVLFRQGIEEIARQSPQTRAHFIPHGVDVDFFSPGDPLEHRPPTLLFVGENSRDLPTLRQVIEAVSAAHPHVCFDLVVPPLLVKPKTRIALRALRRNPRVRWHSRLSDAELRYAYRRATALLLPLKSSGAVNAVVEALACGLPVVSGPSEGIADYGGGSVFPLASDPSEMTALCLRYLNEPARRAQVAAASRDFALENLHWRRIARLHEEIYAAL